MGVDAVVVTGGGAGIGRATVRHLVAAGRAVIAVDRGFAEAALPGEVQVIADCGDEAALAATLAPLPAPQALIAVAGRTRYGTLASTTAAEATLTFSENAGITLATVRAVAPRMGDGGRIVTMASAAALATVTGFLAYSMAKAAILTLTRHLAVELGDRGIAVNALAPGPVETEALRRNQSGEARARLMAALTLKRYATPEEVAAAAAWLIGPEAAWMTGQVLVLDGGFSAGPVRMA